MVDTEDLLKQAADKVLPGWREKYAVTAEKLSNLRAIASMREVFKQRTGRTPYTRPSAKGSGMRLGWWSGCPFCHTADALHIQDGSSAGFDLYYCHECGAGGDVFSFVMRHDDLFFHEAVAMVEAITKGENPPDTLGNK